MLADKCLQTPIIFSFFFLYRHRRVQLLQLHVSVPVHQQPRELLLRVSRRISAPGKQVVSRYYTSPLYFSPTVFFLPYRIYLSPVFSHSTKFPSESSSLPPFLLFLFLCPFLDSLKITVDHPCYHPLFYLSCREWKPLSTRSVMERMRRLGNTNTLQLCVALLSHLCEFICMMLVAWSGFIWSSGARSKGELLFFPLPLGQVQAFIGGVMNPTGCVRGSSWWWIQVAVPEIALWFGARLMGLFSWCCEESAAVRAMWGCIGGFPRLQICRLPSCVSLHLHSYKPWHTIPTLSWTLTLFSELCFHRACRVCVCFGRAGC